VYLDGQQAVIYKGQGRDATRHLLGNRYTGFRYTEEHRWVLDPANQGWQPPP